jgi:hypothetical protein
MYYLSKHKLIKELKKIYIFFDPSFNKSLNYENNYIYGFHTQNYGFAIAYFVIGDFDLFE